jgi:hypothetical protein
MSFFDKVKHFAGGHGVKATITEIERQPPESAKFPLGDSVLKFNVEVTGDKQVTILAHVFAFYAERKGEDSPRLIEVAVERHDQSTEIFGAKVKWPYELEPGRVVRDGCCMTSVDLKKALGEMGVHDVRDALNDSRYEFFVKFTADVKGSPMDAQARQLVRVIR